MEGAFKTLIKSNSRWWCQGRFSCQNIELRPRFSSILVAVQRFRSGISNGATFCGRISIGSLKSSISRLKNSMLRRVSSSAGKSPSKTRMSLKHLEEGGEYGVIRTVCRSRALEMIKKTRWDADGADDVDIEASSRFPWKDFRKKLTKQEETWLSIFRGGASSTETRRQRDEQRCSACGQEVRPSLRHLVTECPIFDAKRKAVSEAWRLDSDFWQRMPRITSKSGWDYFQLTQRCRAQVAVSSRSVPGGNGGAEMHWWALWQARRRSNTNEPVSKTVVRVPAFAA